MRFLLLAGLAAASAAIPLAAQTTNAPGTNDRGAMQQRTIGFLPKADQDRVVAAHDKALADNPKLKLEDEELRKDWAGVRDATPADRMAFMEKRRTHEQKVREAMLKEDPTLGPILDQIDKHLSALRAEREKAMNSGSPGNP